MSPLHPLLESFNQRVKANPRRIVLPEADDARILKAAQIAAQEGLARPILLGTPETVKALAKEHEIDLDGVEILDHLNSGWMDEFIAEYIEVRSRPGKAVREKAAVKMLTNPLYFGAMMMRRNLADGYVAGAATTTANVVRPARYIIGPAEGMQTVSSAALMVFDHDREIGENGAMIWGDPAVQVDPTSEEIADMALCAADTVRQLLQVEPRVALISFSTMGSASHPNATKMIEAAQIARERKPEIHVDGEMQVDAAIIPAIGQRKAPDSPVAGRANALIFPNLTSANPAYKVAERLAHADIYGPFFQGLSRPTSDLSRGCSPEEVVNVIIVTSLRG